MPKKSLPRRRRKNPTSIVPPETVWLTPEQAGRYVNLSPETLKQLARDGKLRDAHKITGLGGRRGAWRFHASGLDELIRSGGVRASV